MIRILCKGLVIKVMTLVMIFLYLLDFIFVYNLCFHGVQLLFLDCIVTTSYVYYKLLIYNEITI